MNFFQTVREAVIDGGVDIVLGERPADVARSMSRKVFGLKDDDSMIDQALLGLGCHQ